MNTQKFSPALAIALLALCANAYARVTQPCWIESVIKTDVGVRVVLDEQYRHALQVIHRGGTIESFAGVPLAERQKFFDLKSGDVASLRGGAHDWCSVTGTVRDGRLGVLIDANSRPHGMEHRQTSSFVLPTD